MIAGHMNRTDSPVATSSTPTPPRSDELSIKPSSVLLMTPRWARDGGVGAHVETSAGLLARNGVDVLIVAARIVSSEPLDGVTVYHRPELFNTRASMDVRLGEALSFQPTVAHLHQVDDPDIVQAMRLSAPVVVSAHGYTACTSGVHYFSPGHECTRAHGLGCIPNLIACAHTRKPQMLPTKYRYATRGLEALRRADLAVSYSSSVDRHLATNGIARRMIVPYFPTLAAKAGPEASARRRVLFAGRIVPAKGVRVLIEAARDVDAEFVICGDGWRLDAMRRLAGRLGVDERVGFTGWLGADRLGEEIANASVVAIPSIWPEPFGLVGIEALAAGRPVVASSTGGVADWLDDNVSGLCVPPGDAPALARALTALLADPERRRAMGLAGRRAVSARFSAERHLAALLEGYTSARSTWRVARGDESVHSGAPVPRTAQSGG
jgi:glycosyltransferase involved in cell wall biosynthesis